MSKKKEKKSEEKAQELNEDPVLEQENKESGEEDVETESDTSLEELREKIQTLEDKLLRKAAEFENYKRRTENDQLNLLKYSAESFILKILPVYDDLNRSVNHLDESNDKSIKEGLQLVFDKFTKILDEQGVQKIDAKGKEFDVDYHEALMQQPSKDFPSNTILEEVEAGYTYKDKVIRHSKVIVSQEIADTENDDKAEPTDENEE